MGSDHGELQEKTADTLFEAEGAMDLAMSKDKTIVQPPISVDAAGAIHEIDAILPRTQAAKASRNWGRFAVSIICAIAFVICSSYFTRAIPFEGSLLTVSVLLFAAFTFIETKSRRELSFLLLGFFLTFLVVGEKASALESSGGWGTAEIEMIFALMAALSFFMSVKRAIIPSFNWLNEFLKWSFGANAKQSETVDCGTSGNSFVMTCLILPISCICLFFAIGQLLELLGRLYLGRDDSIQSILTNLLVLSGLASLAVRWFGNQFALRRLIIFSETGLSFDEDYNDSLQGQTIRAWSTLHSVEFAGALSKKDMLELDNLIGCYLTLSFKPEGSVTLDLSHITRTDVVKLLLQIDAHCEHSVFTKQAFAFSQILLGASAVELDVDEQLMTDNLEAQFASTHFMPLLTGTSLQNGRYKILTQIASGGMSSVYAAAMSVDNSKKTNRTNVVVKESVLPLNTDEKSRLKAKELFARESKMLARLEYPQIVRVLDSFVENERDYIVLEHKEGPTLRQVRQRKQQNSAGAIAEWAYQIAQIMEYLHSLTPPVIHRDLTPDNLILAEGNKIIAIDFGVSNEFLGNATGTLVGKQAYISPEQFRGKSEPKSDIYSFGATLHYLYTGVDPVPLSVSDPRQNGGTVPDAMAELIIEATQQDSAKRPDAHELRMRLENIRGK